MGGGDYVHELVEKTKPHHPFGRFQNKLGVTGVWVALSRSGRGWLVVVVIRCGWQKSGGQELLQCSCWLKGEGLNRWWNDLRTTTTDQIRMRLIAIGGTDTAKCIRTHHLTTCSIAS